MLFATKGVAMNEFSIALKHRRKLFIPALILAIGVFPACAALGDADPDNRWATTVKQDVFGDSFTEVKYLEQGWTPAESLWFYNTTQGSNLMPYDFFMVLEQIGKSELFRTNENMNHYGYLPQKASTSNPDALPVGWVKDVYKKKEYIGLTCAACHTGQINYSGIGIRIDGGPANADLEMFLRRIAIAMHAVIDKKNEEVRNRFVKNVLARGNYKTETEVLDDLEVFTQRLDFYNVVNSNHQDGNVRQNDYGYARLDAFGRIYNRVLEHIINVRELRVLLRDPQIMRDNKLTEEQVESIIQDANDLLDSGQRTHIIQRLTQILSKPQLLRLRDKLFIKADAPVSYPFLWDTPQHDYVQWNGLADNAGLGSIGRNAGEVIGVFGTLDWEKKDGFSLSARISGQPPGDTYINFDSSVNVHNLRLIESHLWRLKSPVWPEGILGKIDHKAKGRGELLFNKYCVSCHSTIDRNAHERRIVAHMSKVEDVGTDAQMANNSINYRGFSGILRNQYVSVGVGDILLDQKAPAFALVTKATLSVVATPDSDKWFIQRWAHWIYDLVPTYFKNEIKPSIKHGNYDPDTTANPAASLYAYKARSLNGIWATAPYLHNGSVPTLYDLLLPKKGEINSRDGEYRPDEFEVGSREFRPKKVGFKSSGYGGFVFKTNVKGNSNAGHEYGVRRTVDESNGPVDQEIKAQCTDKAISDELLDKSIRDKCLYPMSQEERWDLVEYLKTL